MNQKKLLSIVLLFFAYTTYVSAQCLDDRYKSKIFSSVDVESNVVYGTDTLPNGSLMTLDMDVYTPQGDTAKNRPVVILAHGGSFVSGWKAMPDMSILCTGLARRGYVAISMSYRKESALTLQNEAIAYEAMVKIVMRAVQDGKAVIRYVRKSFVELGDPYGVDTANIHIGGSSAGAILAMQLAFMDDVNKLTPEWQDFAAEVGGLEGKNNPGYSTRVNSVISMAGALADTAYLTKENLIPVLSSHSENDGTVLYGEGKPLRKDYLPDLFGSLMVNDRMGKICGVSWFDSHQGSNHPPYQQGIQTDFTEIDSIIGEFLYRQQACYDGISLLDQQKTQQEGCKTTSIASVDYNSNLLEIYPNPSDGYVNLRFEETMDNAIVEIYNSIGQMIVSERMNGNAKELNLSELGNGMYIVRVEDKNRNTAVSKKLLLN